MKGGEETKMESPKKDKNRETNIQDSVEKIGLSYKERRVSRGSEVLSEL